MVIKNVSVAKNKGKIILSADILFKNNKAEMLYFSTDLKNSSFVFPDADPFFAAVLLPCMKTGEDIHIEGYVSKKLLQNTKKIMSLVESWNIGLKKVKIKSISRFKAAQNDKQKFVGSFFSAGVDSFYTYLKHKNKTDKISHLILVHGFDIPLRNKKLFAKTKNIVGKVAKEEKVKTIFVETNIAEIVEKYLMWDFAHGGALAAVGLFLGNGFSKIFIPGGLRYDEIFPYGTHPDLDKLWSTESIKFVHDGTEYNRLGKIMHSVSKSPLALKYLRVCSQNIQGKYNCSRCYKCLQTMIELVCADALDKAKTFGKLDLKKVRKMYYDYNLLYNLQGEANLKVLKKQNREQELQKAIEYSLENSKKITLNKKIIKALSKLDQNYNKRRMYRLVFRLNKNQDRNTLFKLLGKIGALK